MGFFVVLLWYEYLFAMHYVVGPLFHFEICKSGGTYLGVSVVEMLLCPYFIFNCVELVVPYFSVSVVGMLVCPPFASLIGREYNMFNILWV